MTFNMQNLSVFVYMCIDVPICNIQRILEHTQPLHMWKFIFDNCLIH